MTSEDNSSGLLFTSWRLPDKRLQPYWDSIFIPDESRTKLLNYGKLALGEERVDPVRGGLSRLIVLAGEPGTGKSTTAIGLANTVAEISGEEAILLSANAEQFLSEMESRGPKTVKLGFDLIRVAASRQRVFVIIDEVEQLGFAREKVIGSGDPSDIVRGVDVLLRELDTLKEFSNVLVIATTNLTQVVDSALLSRADLKITFRLPDKATREIILGDTFAASNVRIDWNDLEDLASRSQGLSGRELRRCVWRAAILTGRQYTKLTHGDICLAIQDLLDERAIDQEKGGRHNAHMFRDQGYSRLQTNPRGHRNHRRNGHFRRPALAL